MRIRRVARWAAGQTAGSHRRARADTKRRWRVPADIHSEGALVYPPPEIRTSNTELLGTTAGIILTAVVAVLCLAALLGAVFWANAHPDTRRLRGRRRGEL